MLFKMKRLGYLLLLQCIVFSCVKNGPIPDEQNEEVKEGEEEEEAMELDLPEADSTGYPFDLPETIEATLSINMNTSIQANNLLLGANFGGFTTANEKELVRYLNPVTVRFPSGVWSNWYDWEIDRSTYTEDGYDIGDFHRRVMDTWERLDIRTGFPGFKSLYDELGYNLLFTYNLNYDSNEKSVARLLDRESKGMPVTYIELGNEQFWKDQRSARIATPALYYPAARSLSEALKKSNPNVKLSVPLGWRTNQDSYNAAIAKTTDYFDAITLHKYVHYQKDAPTKSAETYKSILTSSLEIETSKEFVRIHAPEKPIWLTEWGVSCGLNAASYLGQADAYLYLFRNQDDYERAEWYGSTTALNPMYSFTTEYVDGGGRPEKSVRNLKKTGHGATYEILRNVFENSTILGSTIAVHELATGSYAVEATAVNKDGKTSVIAINKTFKNVPFQVDLNGDLLTETFTHEALIFKNLQDNFLFDNDENPLKLVKEGSGTIVLPPYSISKIAL